jgi:hypothetical protein
MPRSTQTKIEEARLSIDGGLLVRNWIVQLREELEQNERDRLIRSIQEEFRRIEELERRRPKRSFLGGILGRSDVRDAEFNRGR